MKALLDTAMSDRNAGSGRHRNALETPGTTRTATPAATQASISSPPRPKTNGSPPLSRTTDLPVPGPADHQLLDRGLGDRDGGRESCRRRSARRPAASSARSSVGGQPVVEDHVGLAQRLARLQGEQAGGPGPAADQHDLACAAGPGPRSMHQHVQVPGQLADPSRKAQRQARHPRSARPGPISRSRPAVSVDAGWAA